MMYIINPESFDGRVVNTMPEANKEQLNNTVVDCSDLTFEQYNKKHDGKLIALTWDEFNDKYYTPYNNSLCKPFKETTIEMFEDGLECLPPKRWTRDKDSNQEFFFVGECYTADLYHCYVRKGKKYYSALRSIYSKAEDLFNLKNVE